MSFREKTAWFATTLPLAIWAFYFLRIGEAYANRTLATDDGLLKLFIVCMVITVVLLLALNLISARIGREQFGADPDERERQVEARARSVESPLLQIGVLAVAASAPSASGFIAEAFPADPATATAIVFANAVLLAVIVSQLAHEVAVIIQFRMMD